MTRPRHAATAPPRGHTRTIRHSRAATAYARAVTSEDVEVRRSRRRRRTVSAYREGGRTVVLIPASFSPAEEERWVARMVARLSDRRAAPATHRRGAPRPRRDRSRGATSAGTPGRRACAGCRRWAGAGRRARPSEGTIRVSDRLRDVPDHVLDYVAAPRAGPPARPRPRPGLLAPARLLPAARAGARLPRRPRPRRGARDAPRRSPRAAARGRAGRLRRSGGAARRRSPAGGRRPATSARRATPRSPRPARPAGATAAYRTSRCSRHRPNEPTRTCRSSWTGTASGSSAASPDSSRPSRRAAAHSEASPASRCPPNWNHASALRWCVSRTRSAGRVEDDAGPREVGRRPRLRHGVRVGGEVRRGRRAAGGPGPRRAPATG